MFSIIRNISATSQYFDVSPTAVFNYGMVATLNNSGYIETASNGTNIIGVFDDYQDLNTSTCINGEVKIWTGEFIVETDQHVHSINYPIYYPVASFLTIKDGIWKPAKGLEIICGTVIDYPNSTNNYCLVIQTAFNNTSSIVVPQQQLQFTLALPEEKENKFIKNAKVGSRGGAVCDVCHNENEYLNPIVDYVCRSCLSYKEM